MMSDESTAQSLATAVVARVDFAPTEYVQVTPDGTVYCRLNPGAAVEGEVPVTITRMTLQPIGVYARTVPTNSEGVHGLVLKYQTATGKVEQRVVTAADFNKPELLSAWLSHRGINNDPKFTSVLRRYFSLAQPIRQVLAYDRTGWSARPDGSAIFVLAELDVIGAAEESVFQPGSTTSTANVAQSGTLGEWIGKVARPACAVPWWRFGIMAALSAVLLKVIDEPGRGFHIMGKTSQGKTIGAACAASVYGRGSKSDSDSYMTTWNATRNGLEGTAEAHCDLALVLDELAEADCRAVAGIVYMVTGGVGKTRMRGETSLQRRKSWRVVVLSTGEQSLESKVREAGSHYSAGMAVRIAEIRVDNTGFTVPVDLKVVREIEAAVQRFFGTAGRAFIEQLVGKRYGEPGSAEVTALKSRIEQIEAVLVGDDTDQRRRRAARSFAIVQAAGELATEWGILPPESAPADTCRLAYTIWQDGAGARDTDDARMACERLLDAIDKKLGSTIARLDDRRETAELEGIHRELCGWYEQQDEMMVVYLQSAALKEALGGYALDTFLDDAMGLGIFLGSKEKGSRTVKVPKLPQRPRAYKFSYQALRDFCHGAEEPKQEPVENGTSNAAVNRDAGSRPARPPSCFGNQLEGPCLCRSCPYEDACVAETPEDKTVEERLAGHPPERAAG